MYLYRAAAAALARLSSGKGEEAEEHSKVVANTGAIPPLVELLTGASGDAAQEEAAGALYALAGEFGNRKAITDAGGIGPLVTLLGSDNSVTQRHAKGVLVRLSIESANRALIIKKLVDMLSDQGSSAQEQAAAAIANLASESTDNRTSIVESGGIEPLLGLLESGTPKAKENSTAAISKLAESDSIKKKIADSGGIPLLVNLLASSSNAKELMQYVQLYSLAANALSKLGKGNKENQIKIAEVGAIPSLVALLGICALVALALLLVGRHSARATSRTGHASRGGPRPGSQRHNLDTCIQPPHPHPSRPVPVPSRAVPALLTSARGCGRRC